MHNYSMLFLFALACNTSTKDSDKEEEVIQDSLKAAMDSANALGNDKLADQIGNTITFFTREYVVGRNTD